MFYNTYESFQITDNTTKNYYKITDTDKNDMNKYNVLRNTLDKEQPAGGNLIPPEGGFDASNKYIAGNTTQPAVYSKCSASTSCSTCLATPDCNWCENIKQCVSGYDVYKQCVNDKVLNSIVQCDLRKELTKYTIYFDDEDILPIMGLSRNTENSLTNSSLKIIFDSLKARGYSTTTPESKKEMLNVVEKEVNRYNQMYSKEMSSYIVHGMNDELDEKSLIKAKDIKTHIQDLKDVSRFIHSQNVETFVEGFQHTYDEVESNYNSEVIKNKNIGFYLQIFWVANLVALGTVFFM